MRARPTKVRWAKWHIHMRKRELIETIERANPQFFEPWLNLVYGEEGQKG